MSMIRREGILTVLLLLVTLAAFWPTLLAFHARWASMELGYSHGYPVLLIMLYVIYERRRYLAALPVGAAAVLLPALGLLSLLWLLANAVQVQVIQQLLLPAIVLAWFGAILGWRIALALVVPFLLIYLAVPVWDVLVYPLRVVTVSVVRALLELGQYTAYVDGFHITVPAGKFRVAGGCSGLNYFLTAMTLAVVYAVLYIRQPERRVLFAAVCLLTALVVNWLRVFLLVLIGYHTEMQSPIIADHGTFGWVLFAFALVPLFWFGARLETVEPGDVGSNPSGNAQWQGFSMPVAVITTLVAISGPALAYIVEQRAAANPFRLDSVRLRGFVADDPAAASWSPQFSGYDAITLWRHHGAAGHPVYLRVLHYDVQQQGKELVSDLNRIVDESHVRTAAPATVSGQPLPLEELVFVRHGRRYLVWWGYFVGGNFHRNAGEAKLAQLAGLLRGQSGAALVIFESVCGAANASCDDRRESLRAVVPDAMTAFRASDAGPARQARSEF